MKYELNAPKQELIRLNGKETFTVSDLINILSKLDDGAEVRFGTMLDAMRSFYQDDNLIFRIAYDSWDDIMDDNYVLEIITEI